MIKEQMKRDMTEAMAKFVAYVGKVLPDDVEKRLVELRAMEDSPLAGTIYDTMFENQRLAKELDRPCCQDTGVLQFFVSCGANFPLIGELAEILRQALIDATMRSSRPAASPTSTSPRAAWARAIFRMSQFHPRN